MARRHGIASAQGKLPDKQGGWESIAQVDDRRPGVAARLFYAARRQHKTGYSGAQGERLRAGLLAKEITARGPLTTHTKANIIVDDSQVSRNWNLRGFCMKS